MGYPGITINELGDEIEGFVFSSENSSSHWTRLDAFEGDEYCRVLAKVQVKDGSIVEADGEA